MTPLRQPLPHAALTCGGALLLSTAPACASQAHRASPARAAARSVAAAAVDVRLVTDEADAALAILARRRAGQAVRAADWQRLFASQGYTRLRERETALGRPFTDSTFQAFLLGDTLAAREPALAATVASWRELDLSGAARRTRRARRPCRLRGRGSARSGKAWRCSRRRADRPPTRTQ